MQSIYDWSDNLDIVEVYGYDTNSPLYTGLTTILDQVGQERGGAYLDASSYLDNATSSHLNYTDITFHKDTLHKLHQLDGLLYTTQKGIFSRPSERWEVELPSWSNEDTLGLAVKAGLSEGRLPQDNSYDVAVVLGATKPSIDKRIEFLEQVSPKIAYDKIYGAATKSRLFTPNIDGSSAYREELALKTEQAPEKISEYDLMKDSFSKFKYYPSVKVDVLDAKPNINIHRATTVENAESVLDAIGLDKDLKGLSHSPSDKPLYKALIISNAPYIKEQEVVFNTVLENKKDSLPYQIQLEFAGPSYEYEKYPPNKAAYTLWSSFASYLYKGYESVAKTILGTATKEPQAQEIITNRQFMLGFNNIKKEEEKYKV